MKPRIKRNKDGSITVEVADAETMKFGAVCINPDKPEKQRVYRKIFHNRPIYLPHEYDRAIAVNLNTEDCLVFSMNGYSTLKVADCRRYGVKPGAYEAACKAVLRETIIQLRKKFKATEFRLLYGSSDMGVDQAIEGVAHEFNIPLMGFTCVEWLPYARDVKIPTFVAKDRKEYADCYIKSLDLLIATGGREQALEHDILASCIYNKRIHFVDILNFLSNNGVVPATITDENGKVRVENAAAAFGRNISFYSRENAISATPRDGDIWDSIFANVTNVATDVCRKKMSPERMF